MKAKLIGYGLAVALWGGLFSPWSGHGAAFVCGLFWGPMMWKSRSLRPGMISHAVWDLGIFVLSPMA